MMFYAHYRIVPIPGADHDALNDALKKLEIKPNRITRDFSSHLLKSCDGTVPSFLWRAQVDSINDRYTFPSPEEIQQSLDGTAVVVDFEVFLIPEIDEEP